MVVVEEVSYIINQMRAKGSFSGEVVPSEVPINVVYNCNECGKPTSGINEWYSREPYFYFGTKAEILRRLSSKDNELRKENQIKYPAIFLEMPFSEFESKNINEVTLSLIFANKTNVEWNYKERYENNLKPIIYPMVELFKQLLKTSDNVSAYEIIEKTDAPFYADGIVIANDLLDLVLIKTKIFFNNNCKNFKLCQI